MDNWSPTEQQVAANLSTVLVHRAYQSKMPKDVLMKMKQPPPPGDTFMQDFQKFFDEANVSGTGALNLQEWHVFRKKFTDYMTARVGGAAVLTEAEDTIAWERADAMDPDYQGVKVKDLMHWMQISKSLAMKPESVYRIWYFPFYGRGEPMRLLLTHAGIPWEDMTVPMEDWPNLKAAMPGNTLPALETQDGMMKCGATRAAMRFLSLKYGYYPDDPMRAQECDMLTDGFLDVFEKQREAVFGANNDPSTTGDLRKKLFGEIYPKFLTILEPFCARGQFLCGNKLCTADFWIGSAVFAFFKNPQAIYGHDTGSWAGLEKQFPAFSAWADRFAKANSKRMATRKQLPF